MFRGSDITRRKWLGDLVTIGAASCLGNARLTDSGGLSEGQRIPLKIGHRIVSMGMLGNINVFRRASQIPGLMGVELQATGGEPSLRDWDTVRRYKREADRWGIMVPSIAGVWDVGVNLMSPRARENLAHSIQAGEVLGARTILVPAHGKDAPDLSKESSYGPAVEVLQQVASRAADAGIVLGLESSLSPAEHLKVVKWVARSNVQIYYDVLNMATNGFGDEAIPGIKLLGKDHICQVHVKNNDRLISQPGPIDWSAAFEAFNDIGYEGWYVFETHHHGAAAVGESTESNIEFLRKHCSMPLA